MQEDNQSRQQIPFRGPDDPGERGVGAQSGRHSRVKYPDFSTPACSAICLVSPDFARAECGANAAACSSPTRLRARRFDEFGRHKSLATHISMAVWLQLTRYQYLSLQQGGED